MKTSSTIKMAALSGTVTLVGSTLAAVLYVIVMKGFGRQEILLVSILSGGLALLLFLLFVPLRRRLVTLTPFSRYAVAVVIGIVGGVAWFAVLQLILGSLLMPLAIPSLYCFLAGGLFGGVTMGRFTSRSANFSTTD